MGHVYNLKNSLKFKLLAFLSPFIDQKCTSENVTKKLGSPPPSFGQNPKEEQIFFVKPSQIHIVWEMKNLILKMKFGFANNAEDFKSMLWMKSSPVGLWVGLGQLGGRVERSLAEQQGIVQLCSSCSFIQFMHNFYIFSFLIVQIFTSASQLDSFYRGLVSTVRLSSSFAK